MRLPPAWLVVLSGVVIAMHVGKMPPAIPVLQQALGVTLGRRGCPCCATWRCWGSRQWAG